jgi:hypothetical protein
MLKLQKNSYYKNEKGEIVKIIHEFDGMFRSNWVAPNGFGMAGAPYTCWFTADGKLENFENVGFNLVEEVAVETEFTGMAGALMDTIFYAGFAAAIILPSVYGGQLLLEFILKNS